MIIKDKLKTMIKSIGFIDSDGNHSKKIYRFATDILKLSKDGLRKKMEGERDFTGYEMFLICETLGVDIRDFYSEVEDYSPRYRKSDKSSKIKRESKPEANLTERQKKLRALFE